MLNTHYKAILRPTYIRRCVSFIQQPWTGNSGPKTDSTYMPTITTEIALWKMCSVGGLSIILSLKPTRTSTNFSHQSSIRNKILQNIAAVIKNRISVTRIQENQYDKSISSVFLAFSPMKSLFQIARRRRTSRLFATNAFNNMMNLLTSAVQVFKSHDETHSVASEYPNIHLAKGSDQAENIFDIYH